MKRLLSVVVLVLAAGCDKASPTTPTSSGAYVEYFVTGTATRASMTYASAGEGTAQTGDRTIPWSTGFLAKRGDFVYISAQNAGQTGCVNVEIKLRSAHYKSTQSCGGFVIATASGTVE